MLGGLPISFRAFDSQVSFGSQVSLPHLPVPSTGNVRRNKIVNKVITPHPASSEPSKGVAVVKKSSEVPLNYQGPGALADGWRTEDHSTGPSPAQMRPDSLSSTNFRWQLSVAVDSVGTTEILRLLQGPGATYRLTEKALNYRTRNGR